MSEPDPLKARLRALIAERFSFGGPAELPADEASLLESGVLDSTGVLELIAALEASFGIRVEDDEILPENLDSVAAIAGYLQRKGVHPAA